MTIEAVMSISPVDEENLMKLGEETGIAFTRIPTEFSTIALFKVQFDTDEDVDRFLGVYGQCPYDRFEEVTAVSLLIGGNAEQPFLFPASVGDLGW